MIIYLKSGETFRCSKITRGLVYLKCYNPVEVKLGVESEGVILVPFDNVAFIQTEK